MVGVPIATVFIANIMYGDGCLIPHLAKFKTVPNIYSPLLQTRSLAAPEANPA